MTQDNHADMQAILRARAVLVNGLDSTRVVLVGKLLRDALRDLLDPRLRGSDAPPAQVRSASNALASWRSAVSNPSVNQS